jgi:hypothetical protein
MPEASQEKTRADGAVPFPNGRPQRLSPQYEHSKGLYLRHWPYHLPTTVQYHFQLTSLDQRHTYLSTYCRPANFYCKQLYRLTIQYSTYVHLLQVSYACIHTYKSIIQKPNQSRVWHPHRVFLSSRCHQGRLRYP